MSVSYIDGAGALRQRKLSSGDGTTESPDVFSFSDGTTHERLGNIDDSPINAPNDSGTLSSVMRGFWKSLGSESDSLNPIGSIHAKLRALTGGFGLLGDTAARSGSLLAMIKFLSESFEFSFTESQTTNAVNISTTFTTLIAFDCRGKNILGAQLENTGSTALSELRIQARFHSDSNIWNTIASTSADFGTNNGKQSNNPNAEIIDSSSNIISIPSGGDGWFRMRCSGMESIRIQAKVTSGSTTMSASGITEK